MDADELIEAFQSVVLERTAEGTFVCRSRVPAWCGVLPCGVLRRGQPIEIEEAFPFLTVFLPEAEEAWRDDEWRTSTLWTETGPGGEEVHLEASAMLLGGTPILAISRNERVFRQQQLLLQRARELRMTHRSLVRESEAKDILVHAIVHDLGAPLHSILGALALLAEQPLDDRSAAWVKLALAAATRQRAMIREILDVFAAEHGAWESAVGAGPAPDLSRAVERVIDEVDPVAQRRGVRVEVSAPIERVEVAGDEARLIRVVANLVENALRHSPSGSAVEVRAEPEPGAVRLIVEDRGPGVAAAVRPRLFEKFARDPQRSGGTGLGLYFCRITVERWGGSIGYEPREGGGSRFWIRLQAPGVRAEAPKELSEWRDHG